MAEGSTPLFHNQPGVRRVTIGAREFMCMGALPPFDHPHIFIDMGGDTEAICSYCSTVFVHDPALGSHQAVPPECVASPVTARSTVR